MSTRRRQLAIQDHGESSDRDKSANQALGMINRLKRRAAKTAEASEQKRIKAKAEDEAQKSTRKAPSPTKASKTEQTIPKKAKKTLTIPKKSSVKDGEKTQTSENGKTKKETPSLLSGMKKPLPIIVHSIKKDKQRPLPSSRGPPNTIRPKSPQRMSPAPRVATPPPPSDAANLIQNPGPTNHPSSRVVTEVEKLRKLVWDGLRDLCKETFPVPPERNGVDLFASFLRHKDLKPGNNLQYDFFDTDEETGNIVLQPKIPIFPEDFPQGAKQWPLSWWGIVDPSIEDQKTEVDGKVKGQTDTTAYTKSRRDISDSQSDKISSGAKDESSDRDRRGGNHSTRKRSSRDRHDSEGAYYDDNPSREANRDRFLGGERDGSGCPPSLRENGYDYDRNDFRIHNHRDGGPPFPHRMGDGPPPHSRRDSRDRPPHGDFRRGSRPYPGQGGDHGRDYNFRDQYGPTGRGPHGPFHDDRRNMRNIDRSSRPSYSHSAREDGWDSRRHPSGNPNRQR